MLYHTTATTKYTDIKKDQILENNQPFRDPGSVCNVKMPISLRTQKGPHDAGDDFALQISLERKPLPLDV